MLLNLSNHPHAGWSLAQQAAAAAFGKVVDLAFPTIPSDADTAQVQVLAADYAMRCREILNATLNEINAVHIMGEMTFTFAVVAQLQAHGITCVASTTERVVEEEAEGSRRVMFHFVRFRAYPMLGGGT